MLSLLSKLFGGKKPEAPKQEVVAPVVQEAPAAAPAKKKPAAKKTAATKKPAAKKATKAK